MLDLLLKIQQNRETIKKIKKVLKEESNNNLMKKMKREFEGEKAKYKIIDSKLKDVRQSIEKLDKKLDDLKGNMKLEEAKLYGNLKYDLKFINTLEKSVKLKEHEIKSLEEESLNALYEEENLLKEKEIIRRKLIDIKDEFYNNRKIINEKIIKAKEDIKIAEHHISNCERKVPKKLLDKFNELCSAKGTGAAELSNGVCLGCRMKVSAITIDDIKNNKDIVYCDNCGRIIYYHHGRPCE
ncbi:zinc ribbon domain-containing protein [Clostridium sp. JNZ X4-2]